MRHLDLFSGIGGFALAASWVWGAEHKIVSFCEIDPFCQKVLKKHWPGVPIIPDIKDMTYDALANIYYDQLTLKNEDKTLERRKIEPAEREGITLLTGGFP